MQTWGVMTKKRRRTRQSEAKRRNMCVLRVCRWCLFSYGGKDGESPLIGQLSSHGVDADENEIFAYHSHYWLGLIAWLFDPTSSCKEKRWSKIPWSESARVPPILYRSVSLAARVILRIPLYGLRTRRTWRNLMGQCAHHHQIVYLMR